MNLPNGRKDYCVVLGGGGHAAVLIEALCAAGASIARAVLDNDESQWGRDVLGVPVLGGDDMLAKLVAKGADCFIVGLGAVGTGTARRRLFEHGISCGLEPLHVAHPLSLCSASATLDAGCQLLPRSLVHTRAVLGCNVIVNCGAIIEHDCRVGDHVHVATGALLAGGVIVGSETLIGLGACVRQSVHIGNRAIVAAGAVVVHDVPDDAVVAGVPAEPLPNSLNHD